MGSTVPGAALPGSFSSSSTTAYNDLFPYRQVLLHTDLVAQSKILVVCPQKHNIAAQTLREMVAHYHEKIEDGLVVCVHIAEATLPTLTKIREALGGRRDQEFDTVVVFGYTSVQRGLSPTAIKLWIHSLCEFIQVRFARRDFSGFVPPYERHRGELLLELAPKDKQPWVDVASQYHDWISTVHIRLDALNSMQGSDKINLCKLARRCNTLVHNLEKLPGGSQTHERFIDYLKVHARNLTSNSSLVNQIGGPIGKDDAMFGLFIPDNTLDDGYNPWTDWGI